MTITFDRLLPRVFGKSSSLSNICANVAFVACVSVAVLLGVYNVAELEAVRYVVRCAALGCIYLAVASSAVGFLAQTVSQIIRLLSKLTAKINKQEAPVFREEVPLYAKVIKKAFRATQEKGANLFRTLKMCPLSKIAQRKSHIRAGRAYRSPSRSAVHASSSSGSSGDGESDSGEGNQGEPSLPPSLSSLSLKYNLSFISPLCELNKIPSPWRFVYVPGCWRMGFYPQSTERGCSL